MSKQEKMISR